MSIMQQPHVCCGKTNSKAAPCDQKAVMFFFIYGTFSLHRKYWWSPKIHRWTCKVFPFVTGFCHFALVLTFFHPSHFHRGQNYFLAPPVHRKADQKGVCEDVCVCVLWRVINYTQAIFCITPLLCPPSSLWGFRGCFRLLITSPITIRLETCNLPRRKRENQSIVSVALHTEHRPERAWEGEDSVSLESLGWEAGGSWLEPWMTPRCKSLFRKASAKW